MNATTMRVLQCTGQPHNKELPSLKYQLVLKLRNPALRGTWVAQSVKQPTFDLSSGGLQGRALGSALGMEAALKQKKKKKRESRSKNGEQFCTPGDRGKRSSIPPREA